MIQNRVIRWLAGAPFYIGGAIGVVVMLAGFAPFIKQVLYWLKEGVWRSEPLRSSLEYLGVLDPDKIVFEKLVGVSKIAEWFLDINVTLICFPLALIIAGFCAYYEDKFLEDAWGENDKEGETNG